MTLPLAFVLRSVEVRLVKARDEEVALVVVLFSAVKFWRVDEPATKRLASVPNPLMKVFPSLAFVEKRLVDDAVVAKNEVEVAFVVVERVMLSKICAAVKVFAV